MPALFDEQGNPVEASGLPNNTQTPKTEEEKSQLLYKILHGASIFGNEATMGAVPAVANLAAQVGMGKGASEGIQKYLSDAEQDIGEEGTFGLKLAGALATPLPFGKVKAATTLGKIGMGMAKGAGLGAVSAGLHNIGTAAPGEISGLELAKDTAVGAGLGGAVGGAFGGGSAYLAARAERSGMGSVGGTAGRISDAAKNYPVSEYSGLKRAEDVIGRGRDMMVPGKVVIDEAGKKTVGKASEGIQGKFAQTFHDVAERANRVAMEAGATEGEILAKEGRLVKLKLDTVRQHTLDPLIDELSAKGITGRGDKRVIAELERQWNSFTKDVDSLGNLVDKPNLSIEQLARMRESLSDTLQGAYGEGRLVANKTASMLAKFRSNISDLEDVALKHIVPDVGAKFVKAKEQYHSAMVLRAMSTKGHISDEGLMETLLGRGIRGMANTAALTKLGLAGPAAYMATSGLAAGRIPNTFLALDKAINRANLGKTRPDIVKRALNPLTTQRAGMQAGKLAGSGNEF